MGYVLRDRAWVVVAILCYVTVLAPAARAVQWVLSWRRGGARQRRGEAAALGLVQRVPGVA